MSGVTSFSLPSNTVRWLLLRSLPHRRRETQRGVPLRPYRPRTMSCGNGLLLPNRPPHNLVAYNNSLLFGSQFGGWAVWAKLSCEVCNILSNEFLFCLNQTYFF